MCPALIFYRLWNIPPPFLQNWDLFMCRTRIYTQKIRGSSEFEGLTWPGTAITPKSAQFGQFWCDGRAWLRQPFKLRWPTDFLGINYCSTYKKVSILQKWWGYVSESLKNQGGTLCLVLLIQCFIFFIWHNITSPYLVYWDLIICRTIVYNQKVRWSSTIEGLT